jgi:hypothetical protein
MENAQWMRGSLAQGPGIIQEAVIKPYILKGLRHSITYQNIVLDDSNPDWYRKTNQCMDRLWDMPIGRKTLDLIRLKHQHTVEIVPSENRKNTCKSGGVNEYERFVTLRQAFYENGGRTVQEELGRAIRKMAGGQLTENHVLDFLASQLARGLSPVTLHTDQNVKGLSTLSFDAEHRTLSREEKIRYDNRSKGQIERNDPIVSIDERTRRVRQLLDDVLSGKTKQFYGDLQRMRPEPYKGAKTEGTHRMNDDLIRLLKNYLTPGEGASCKIRFDPDAEYACELDAEGTRRPPAIGLAHELCHAWRNVSGLRLFEDSTRSLVDDDEIMTTGLPPYENEEVSENMFRAQWQGEQLQMRKDYDTYVAEEKSKEMITEMLQKK